MVIFGVFVIATALLMAWVSFRGGDAHGSSAGAGRSIRPPARPTSRRLSYRYRAPGRGQDKLV